jgi:hypothetical protein
MTLEALRSVPLFASLDDEAAKELRSLLSEQNVASNTRLFRQVKKATNTSSKRPRADQYSHEDKNDVTLGIGPGRFLW